MFQSDVNTLIDEQIKGITSQQVEKEMDRELAKCIKLLINL